jgi:hypothetical protein
MLDLSIIILRNVPVPYEYSLDMEISDPERTFIRNVYSSVEIMRALAPKQRLSLITM